MPAPATPSSANAPQARCRTSHRSARYAPLATVVNNFYYALHTEDRRTPYPAEEIAQQLERAGLPANRSPR